MIAHLSAVLRRSECKFSEVLLRAGTKSNLRSPVSSEKKSYLRHVPAASYETQKCQPKYQSVNTEIHPQLLVRLLFICFNPPLNP